MKKILIAVCIMALALAFAPFSANAEGTYTLTVASSNPSSGVAITVSPSDRNGQSNGTTQFTRSYSSSTSISLTAPSTASGNTFQKWQRDGSDYSTNRTITFSLSMNRTMKAVYVTSTSTSYTLTVASSNPSSGVAITVSPSDRNGQSNGTTQFTRSYNSGTAVSLTAPSSSGSNAFSKWQKNGVDAGTSRTISVTMTANTTMTAVFGTSTSSNSNYTVIARNDLGMHCACPSFAGFLLLPPFNTIRVQVLKRGSDSVSVVSSGITVNYSLAEETDASLQSDPYFSQWIAYSPKLFPGFAPVVNGKVMGIAGYGISGTATYDSTSMSWNAVGIPAYPVTTGNTSLDIMTDPLGGPNRDPYLTANITVKDSTGATIGTTSTVVPVAFGGCCTCHLKLAGANGYPATPAGSFAYMGVMHSKNSSGINISLIDPDGDGVGGPVRCSWCHFDPAMGEMTAPGWPTGTKLLPGAGTLKKSVYSFSDVLHRFHAKDALVLSSAYDPNIAKNCYDCHPGNNVNCSRGIHKSKNLWCTDCHGDLNQRVATGQLSAPWQESTLPSCYNPAKGISSAYSCHATVPQTTWASNFGGYYINGRGGMGSHVVLCESCHGSAHGEAPSTLALDNVENAAIHDMYNTTFPTGKDKTYALGTCKMCHTNEGNNVWDPRVMYGD